MIQLFHVSKNPKLTTLIPTVPKHFMTAHLLEEGTTKRVSFAPSIQKCLRAVQSRMGDTYYVYVPTAIDKKYLRRPSVYEVPDARLTGEYWYLKPVNVRLYAVIKSGKLYNPRVFQIGGIEAKRPKDMANLFSISRDREYELLKRYNKNGKELTIKVALRNKAPFEDKNWRDEQRMRNSRRKFECDDYYEDDSVRERLRKFENQRGMDDFDEEEYERELDRRRRKRATKKKLVAPLLKGILGLF